MKEKLRFLGLDVHAETIAVAIAEADGEVRSLGTIPNRLESIRKLIKKLGPTEKLRACYEAGPTGYVVYWQLAELGVKCDVVAPTLVPVKAGDRVKTDRRDAEKLARSHRSGDLTAVWVPDEGLRGIARSGAYARSSEAGSVAGSSSAEQIPAALGSASADWNQAVDASLSDLGCAVALHPDGSGGDAARLSARSRTHARTGGATGTSHHRGGQVGLARVTASHQRSTSPARYRRYLGCDHRGRVGPGVPLRQCSATDGILRCCAQRGFQRQADPARERHQNGQRAFEKNRRRSGMELSSPTLYLVRVAQTTGEYFRRGQRDCVESTTPAAQALHEAGCSRQG